MERETCIRAFFPAISFLLDTEATLLLGLGGDVAETSGCAPQTVAGTVSCVCHTGQQKGMFCLEPLPRDHFSVQGSLCHLPPCLLLKRLKLCPMSGSGCDPPAWRAVNDCKELCQGRRGWKNCSAGRGMGGTFNELCKELVPTASNELNVYSLLAW